MQKSTKEPTLRGRVYSGRVIGAVVEALDLGEGVLTGRTARRFFGGEPINEYDRGQIFMGLGSALVEGGVIPVPPMFHKAGLSMPEFIREAIAHAALRWDNLQATTQSRGPATLDTGQAAYQFLRIVVVDVALRAFALLRLANLQPHPPTTPLWAQENGGGKVLRELTKNAGLTRKQLAARLETSSTSVDNWLDGKNRPSPEYFAKLAGELATPGLGKLSFQLEQDIRRQFTFSHLADLLAPWIGREQVIILSTALVRFAWQLTEGVRKISPRPVEEAGPVELTTLRYGTADPFVGPLLEMLAQSEADLEWRRDILAAATNWNLPFQAAAIQAGQPRSAAGLAQDIQDVTPNGSPLSTAEQEAMQQLLADERQEHARIIRGDLRLLGQLHEAGIVRRRAIVHQFPESSHAHFQLGSYLGMAGKHLRDRSLIDEGITECKIAAGLLPEWDAPAVEPGIILANIGAFDEALSELHQAWARLPVATPHFRVNIGYVLRNLSRYAEALEHLEQVLNDKPDYALAALHAAHCAFSLGDPRKGLHYAKVARRLGEPSAYHAWTNGKYSRRRKKGN